MKSRIPLPPHLSATPFTFRRGLDAGLGHNRLRSADLQRPPHRAPVGRGIRGHTLSAASGEVGVWRGLRICSPERTWCQLGALLTLADLVAAGDYLIHASRHRPAFSTGDRMTDAVAHYPGRRGRRVLRAALGLLDAASGSPQESVTQVTGGQG